MTVAVLGAGPAGLAAAHRLATRGADVHLFEAADVVGGLARSIELWGRPVDLGSHIFATDDDDLAALWSRLVGTDRVEFDLCRGILTTDGVYRYPPEAVNALRLLGPRRAARSALELAATRRRPPGPASNAEEAVVAVVGRPLYERLFRRYAEKLWGVPCDQVDPAFAATLFGGGGGPRPLAGILRHRRQRVVWPTAGSGAVWKRMADEIGAAGGIVHLRSPVQRLMEDDGRVVGVEAAGAITACDEVISSLPVPLLARLVGPLPEDAQQAAAGLRARSTILVFLHIDHRELFAEHWLYVDSERLSVGRVTNASRWWPEGSAASSTLVCEYWCSDGDELWAKDDKALAALAAAEVRAAGLDRRSPVLAASVHRLPRSHPALTLGFTEHLGRLTAHLDGITGLHRIGRHGSFSVGSMSESMANGIASADAVLARALSRAT